jgi:hypothetical protein
MACAPAGRRAEMKLAGSVSVLSSQIAGDLPQVLIVVPRSVSVRLNRRSKRS